jgi:endonuclease/exonuclease/phosphatase family metal-dependent hydrolase
MSGVKFLFSLLLLSLQIASAADSTTFRVFCWNLHHGVGTDGKLDLPRIAAVIRAAKPDMVTLQEVDQRCGRSGKVDQTAELATLTGMTGVFGKAMDFDGGAYGQAILSKHPILEQQVHALPGKGEPRITFEAVIDFQGSPIRLVSLHLDLDNAQRLNQAKTIVEIFRTKTSPVIVCGDFNDTPDSEPLQLFVPPWVAVPKQAQGFSFPSALPSSAIDHFVVKGIKPSGLLKVVDEPVASDHRPIMVDFFKPES